MKMRLLLILAELAIGFVVPAFAQQKDTVDQRITQQRDLFGDANALGEFGVLGIKEEEAFKKNDAVAVAALFTEDGVLMAPNVCPIPSGSMTEWSKTPP
jgi:hypothetical protein